MRNEKGYPKNYVHWYKMIDPSETNYMANKYEAIVEKNIRRITSANLAASYKKRLKSNIGVKDEKILDTVLHSGSLFIGTKGRKPILQQAFDTVADIMSQSFQTLGEAGLSNEDVNKYLDDINERKQLLGKEAKKVSEFLENMGRSLNLIETVFNDSLYKDYYKLIGASTKSTSIKNVITSDFGVNLSKPSYVNTNKVENLNKGHQEIYNQLKQAFDTIKGDPKQLEKYLAELRTTKVTNSKGKTEQWGFKAFSSLFSIFKGLVNEAMIYDIDTLVKEKLVDKALSSGGKLINVRYEGNKTNTSPKISYKFPTVDIFYDTKLRNGSLTVQVPIGATIKSAAGFNPKKPKIKIKSTSLQKLIQISQTMGYLKNGNFTGAFANIALHHENKNAEEFGSPYISRSYTDACQRLNHLFMVTGLAGSLTKEDMATVLVVNNQVYNIYEIIAKSNENSIVSNLSSEISKIRDKHNKFRHVVGQTKKAKHKTRNMTQALKRSSTALDKLYSRTIDLQLQKLL